MLSEHPHVMPDDFYERIASVIREARAAVVRTIDSTMVKTYWHIGKYIVEEEQKGAKRAGYGNKLLKVLSIRLSKEFGRGFGTSTLADTRQFYLAYHAISNEPIFHALRGKSDVPENKKPHAVSGKLIEFTSTLSWTHYRTLMRISRPEARQFYEIEATKNNWSARELERQVNSLLFDRLAKSKDKQGLLRLINEGQEVIEPSDAIKDPFVLEFLNIPEAHQLTESKLEQALISNLRHFLLELGKGFAFIARQKRLTLDGKHYYTDLVFYHTILKCYILIDLKTHELTHADLGQMLLYVNYYDRECLAEGDNPTIGLVLCTEKSEAMASYLLGEKAKQIFASKYQFHLPSEKELETELKRKLKQLQHKSK